MAQVDNNIFVRGLTGAVGNQFVIRKGRNGTTVISNKPSFPQDREFNESQLAHQKAFRRAIAYAQSHKGDEIYIRKAEGTTKTAFNAAVADWFKKPEILEVDASDWKGNPGQVIWVEAMDDTEVTSVRVSIRDAIGAVLEEGDAQRAEDLWWTYTANTTVPMQPKPQVVVTAVDRPGNFAEVTLHSN